MGNTRLSGEENTAVLVRVLGNRCSGGSEKRVALGLTAKICIC